MTTKYFSARNIANAILVIILLTSLLILTSGNAGAKVVGDSPGKWTYSRVGECLAYKTSDALYPGVYNDFCEGEEGNSSPQIIREKSKENASPTLTISTPTATTVIPATNPPATSTPIPATATPEPESTEPSGCETKNKNDDKKPGENPCDGDAGGGNG